MSTANRMPALFIGHGNPMNAIEDNQWSRAFRALGETLPVPKAVLAISAHWYVPGTFTTGNEKPETIHDFGGFPQELFDAQYPAPGDSELARKVVKMLGSRSADVRFDWGLDHGTWSVLCHLRPNADVPVVQLSIDRNLAFNEYVDIGRAIAGLREEGVMIIGSGNITHNLRDAFGHIMSGDSTTPDWAAQFDSDVASAIEQRDTSFLSRANEGELGRQNHPTWDHYVPLLYTLGATDPGESLTFPITGFDAGSLSMRAAQFG
ncbi:MAG: 4,5-DOPA dioxygenase extradiol [Chthonomonadales bacterium]